MHHDFPFFETEGVQIRSEEAMPLLVPS